MNLCKDCTNYDFSLLDHHLVYCPVKWRYPINGKETTLESPRNFEWACGARGSGYVSKTKKGPCTSVSPTGNRCILEHPHDGSLHESKGLPQGGFEEWADSELKPRRMKGNPFTFNERHQIEHYENALCASVGSRSCEPVKEPRYVLLSDLAVEHGEERVREWAINHRHTIQVYNRHGPNAEWLGGSPEWGVQISKFCPLTEFRVPLALADEFRREMKAQQPQAQECPEDDPEIVKRMTAAMREADEIHEEVGGGTRHHVRDCLLPVLSKHGLVIHLAPEKKGTR